MLPSPPWAAGGRASCPWPRCSLDSCRGHLRCDCSTKAGVRAPLPRAILMKDQALSSHTHSQILGCPWGLGWPSARQAGMPDTFPFLGRLHPAFWGLWHRWEVPLTPTLWSTAVELSSPQRGSSVLGAISGKVR